MLLIYISSTEIQIFKVEKKNVLSTLKKLIQKKITASQKEIYRQQQIYAHGVLTYVSGHPPADHRILT